MSDYGWLRGEYKIPTKEWTQVKKTLRDAYNSLMSDMYENALKVHEEVAKRKKGKRNINLEELAEEVALQYVGEKDYWIFKISDSIVKNNKLVKPKKKDFPKATSSTTQLYDDNLTLSFEKDRVLKFRSDDGNYSQALCLKSYLGKTFLRVIDRIQWTSKTGGYLRFFNEYMRDNGLEATVQSVKGKYAKTKYFKTI